MVPYKDLFVALAQKKIKYVVAGGFAVNFHQVQRATSDLDLIVHLEESNLKKFLEIIEGLGYQPRLPVEASDFSNAEKRKEWIEEKNMTVFSFNHPKNLFETIDVFVREPKPFSEMERAALHVKAFDVDIPVLGLEDLIEIKTHAGRDKDLFDVDQLRKKQKR